MFRQPRFKPHLRVVVVPGEGIFLLSEQKQTVLRGRLYELVAANLDGQPTEEVCSRLRGQASPAEVFYTLIQLEQKGHLTESNDSLPANEAAFWCEQGAEVRDVVRRLAETMVDVRVVGDVDVEPFRALLLSLHVRLGPEAALTVVVTDGELRRDLQAWNREALQAGKPWLLVKPVGRKVWLGPLFVPGKTGCWSCLADRIRANAPVLGYLEGKTGHLREEAERAWTPATMQVAWGLAATAVSSWITHGNLPSLEGKIQTLDVLTGQTETHVLVRQPSCEACGSPAPSTEQTLLPLILQSCKKTFTEDGGHRAISPQQTLERYGHHVSPITGAVSMLQRDTVGDGVLHVYLSGQNIARRVRTLAALRTDLRSTNCGKGTSDVQAKASALCEGLERYSGVFQGDEPRLRARFLDLKETAIHPNSCMQFSEKQYRDREEWNARGHSYDEVPLPFDPQAEIEWSPVWSLTRQTVRYLPTAFCYFNCPQECERAFCWSCSNGNAAGNTREEAILQGFLELVERDSVALWWYNRVRRPGVDLDSFREPYLSELQAFLRGRGRNLWALDLTSDLGIPVFAAVSQRTSGEEQILFGFGAHLEARVALLRAVTEMNQMLGAILDTPANSPPGNQFTDKMTVRWLQTATVANQPYLLPLNDQERTASSYRPCRSEDLKDDVLSCQSLVERHGMEMLVLDQTRAEIGIPVVKVIVPGLRHFWPRFAPGRLYDVPVGLGWLPQALREEQLNPIPMFL